LNVFAYSQIRESGVIQGNVTDMEGLPLPGFTVTIESPNLIGGAHSRVTDVKGFYKYPSLSIGKYKITAEMSGFNTLVKEGINLHANMTLTIDSKMAQASLTKEVMVEAIAPTIDIKNSLKNLIKSLTFCSCVHQLLADI